MYHLRCKMKCHDELLAGVKQLAADMEKAIGMRRSETARQIEANESRASAIKTVLDDIDNQLRRS